MFKNLRGDLFFAMAVMPNLKGEGGVCIIHMP
jgi:hypothetical protein